MMRLPCVLVLTLLFAACAQVRDISGGEKDTVPPRLIEARPADLSTGFTGRRIELVFDERVKVANARQQLLVSPPLATMPDVHVLGGNTVVIALDEELAPATTYSFNFGDAVVDLTEGNAAGGLTYVVSTGDHLDSASIEGRVLDAFTGKPADGVQVLLFPSADTAGFTAGRPRYAGRTDKEGRFTLDHLRTDSYRLHALRDQNSNLRYDLPNEDLAFLRDTLVVPGAGPQLLWLFRELPRSQQVLDQRVGPDRDWQVVLARPAVHAELRDIDRSGGRLSWTLEQGPKGDSLRFWPNDTTAVDGHRFALMVDDLVLDTLTYRARERMAGSLQAALALVRDTLLLTASRPLAAIDAQRMELRVDGTDRSFTTRIDTVSRRQVWVVPEGGLGNNLSITLEPKALRDIYSAVNDTLRLGLEHPGPDQLGTLTLKVVTDSLGRAGPWLLQLLDAQDRAVRTIALPKVPNPLLLEALTPGSYGLKLVEDRDGSGVQDTGDLGAARLPEPAWRFPGTLVIRAGWQVDQGWTPLP